jgi:hypothetical protein
MATWLDYWEVGMQNIVMAVPFRWEGLVSLLGLSFHFPEQL